MDDSHWLPSNLTLRPQSIPLICFAHAGGGTAMFHAWARQFSPPIQVVPVCLPGREHRFSHPPFRRLEDLMAVLEPVLQREIGRPAWFFGHSLGGLLAYESAVRCQPTSTLGLIISSCPAPSTLPRNRQLSLLPDAPLMRTLVADYGYTGSDSETPHESEMMQAMLTTIRADLELFESYRPQRHPLLDACLLSVGGADDRSVPRHDLEAWRLVTRGTFQCRLFPGGHFYLKQGNRSLLPFLENAILRQSTP